MLPREAVIEYQQIYEETFGIKIPYDEALKQGTKLIDLFRTVYKPIPDERDGTVKAGVDNNPQVWKT